MNKFLLSNETWGVSNSARVYLAKSAQNVHSSWDNLLQLLGLLFVFVLVLLAAWYVSRFIGNKAMGGFGNKNINVIEKKFNNMYNTNYELIATGIKNWGLQMEQFKNNISKN